MNKAEIKFGFQQKTSLCYVPQTKVNSLNGWKEIEIEHQVDMGMTTLSQQ